MCTVQRRTVLLNISAKFNPYAKEFNLLKGVCHEILNLHFIHDSNPPGPLINRL